MIQTDLIWLAGLLEGEGCFSPQKGKQHCRISIEMTDEDVIQKVALLFGNSYCSPKLRNVNWKQSYITVIRGLPALSLMKELLPYMGKRRTLKINECINSYNKKRKSKLTEEQIDKIKEQFNLGIKPKEIAKSYPVSFWRIYQIVRT